MLQGGWQLNSRGAPNSRRRWCVISLSEPTKRDAETLPFSFGMIASLLLFLLPCIVGGLCALGYAFKLLSVFPSGKDSWIEEGLYSMAFHAICLTVVFPLFIMAVARNWHLFPRWWCRLLVVGSMLAAMVLIVVIPEVVVNSLRENRYSHFQGHRGQPLR